MKAIPYLRTSTDDKGQNPARQLDVIRAWADREGVDLLPAIVDEGSSASKEDPFARPRFVRACEEAQAAGAVLVMEEPDRLTRQDSEWYGWARVELRRRYKVEAFFADAPRTMQATMAGRILATSKAELGAEWVKGHAQRVRTGMATAKAEGKHVGRPRKTLSPAEIALARALQGQGQGFRRVALELSRRRGAFDVADPALQRRRALSEATLRRALAASKP